MLVLSRYVGQQIIITVPPSDADTVVSVMVISLRNDKARLGVQADRGVTIHRKEIADLIAEEEAGDGKPPAPQ